MANVASEIVGLIRPKQWAKNFLLGIPLLASHRVGEPAVVEASAIAFFSFSLMASSGYVWNDLLDRNQDRLHPRKKNRPIASGRVSTATAVAVGSLLFGASLALGLLLPAHFNGLTLSYFATVLVYSFWLKKIPIADTLCLSGFYTYRIFVGASAAAIPISQWLLSFSVFFFLNLAFLKRYSDILLSVEEDRTFSLEKQGRGYPPSSAPLVRTLGVSCGLISILVLLNYIHSDQVRFLYSHPARLWLLFPLLLYWVIRQWWEAEAEGKKVDPLDRLLADRQSFFLVLLGLLILISAWVHS